MVVPRVTLSNKAALLGAWLTLSRVGDSVLVTAGPDANFIYSSVFSAVLNNSRMVDFRSSSRGIESFYFTKPDTWQATDDIAQLR